MQKKEVSFIVTSEKNRVIKELYNETLKSIQTVIPLEAEVGKAKVIKESLPVPFGVLIDVTGDIQGTLVLKANDHLFGSIGEAMFGMPLEGEMLHSFSGELGNMIAGSVSTGIYATGLQTDITSPLVASEENMVVENFHHAIQVELTYQAIGKMEICLLVQ
ncbi:chemotaxis protein CheX [Virgibacillus senegalensis]|uniref:chemotaxis protein CheX n=1 Tax=Virgibacillus senegalensis TaxID=1499679 RepID=UPI00069EB185|nr:chemotaxis protein CheX [Virgibacillus senegalensis]